MSSSTGFAPLVKKIYGPAIKLLPSDNQLSQQFPFVEQAYRPGESYNFPVKMSHEHGVTHWADRSAATLNSVVDAVWKNASLDGSEILVAANIPYGVIAAMMNGATGSYGDAVGQTIDALLESGDLYRELNIMYGGGTGSTLAANIGVVSASISGADLNAGQVINITKPTWSAGLWNNMTNAIVDVYQSDGSTVRATECTVTAPVLATNRITLTKSGSAAVVATGDLIILRSSKAKSCYGVQAILENTGSIFSISAASYPQWQALSQSAGSTALALAIVDRACARLSQNGAKGGASLYLNANAFADLSGVLRSNERYIEPKGSKTTGADSISIKTTIGQVDVKIHAYMKQGIGMLITNDNGRRVGPTDLTTGMGKSDDWFYHELDAAAGGQLRIYSNQAPVLQKPYHCCLITNIVSNGDTAPA